MSSLQVDACLVNFSPFYSLPACRLLRGNLNQFVGVNASAATIIFAPRFDPASKAGEEWLRAMRVALQDFVARTGYNASVSGFGADSMDSVTAVRACVSPVIRLR